MAARNYPRLDIYEFGQHLLETGDLDPVYIALDKMEWSDPAQLERWLLAYWCFYHCGAASYISEMPGELFWERMEVATTNTTEAPDGGRWPRGSERRHFRGEAAVNAVAKMKARWLTMPERAVHDIAYGVPPNQVTPVSDRPQPFAEVAARAKGLPLFGPWIAFKVCDMLDRLGIAPVDFDEAAVFMFDDPTKAALMLWRAEMKMPENAKPKDQARVIQQVVTHLIERFEKHTAPPRHERKVGLQEIETILCKWKSHMNGHYPLYNDIHEINEGLRSWAPHSETARAMLHAMPPSRP